MVKSYCTYGMYNEDTSECVEQGENLNMLSYWSNGYLITLEDVHVSKISKDEVTLELLDSELTINITDIEEWK